MAHAHGAEFQGAPGDPLTQRTLPLFFDVLRLLVGAGVTVVAEAAFQDRLWRPGLGSLAEQARLRIVRCRVDPSVSFRRAAARAAASESRLRAHGDSAIGEGVAEWALRVEAFEHVSLDVPALDVDTTDGYDPALEQVVGFVNRD
jgi:predicted kinase